MNLLAVRSSPATYLLSGKSQDQSNRKARLKQKDSNIKIPQTQNLPVHHQAWKFPQMLTGFLFDLISQLLTRVLSVRKRIKNNSSLYLYIQNSGLLILGHGRNLLKAWEQQGL